MKNNIINDWLKEHGNSEIERQVEDEANFLMGWNAATEKLKQIINQLQKEDISSVVYALREVIKRMDDEK